MFSRKKYEISRGGLEGGGVCQKNRTAYILLMLMMRKEDLGH